MTRAFVWACVGGLLGVLALAAYGAFDGCSNGWVTGRRLPPGLEAATVDALFLCAYFGWAAFGLGALFGAATGAGSACVGHLVARKKTQRPAPPQFGGSAGTS